MDDRESIVDIPMCAYNHERYIAQAIEGVANQKTNFRYRLIIGEDCSTDTTRDIVKRYLQQFPDKMKVFFHEKNLGATENSRILFNECNAKYIALCDGDDFWSDSYKLQRQVDFLESNPQYVGCFHNSEERIEDNETIPSYLYCHHAEAREITFKELAFRNEIPTCSVVYRNKLFGEFPEWFRMLKMGDWPLHLLNSQHGAYWYIPKIMGVHRHQSGSTWMLDVKEKTNNYIIEAYDIMIKGFSYNQKLVDQLIEGRKAFIKSAALNNHKPGLKTRVKSLMIRAIGKL